MNTDMTEEVKADGFFKKAGNKIRGAGKKVADVAWRGGTKRKYVTGAGVTAGVGVAGYYALRKVKARRAARAEMQ